MKFSLQYPEGVSTSHPMDNKGSIQEGDLTRVAAFTNHSPGPNGPAMLVQAYRTEPDDERRMSGHMGVHFDDRSHYVKGEGGLWHRDTLLDGPAIVVRVGQEHFDRDTYALMPDEARAFVDKLRGEAAEAFRDSPMPSDWQDVRVVTVMGDPSRPVDTSTDNFEHFGNAEAAAIVADGIRDVVGVPLASMCLSTVSFDACSGALYAHCELDDRQIALGENHCVPDGLPHLTRGVYRGRFNPRTEHAVCGEDAHSYPDAHPLSEVWFSTEG